MARSPILVPGLLSLGLYLFAALRFEASNRALDVFGFLALFAALYVLCGFAYWRSETFRFPNATHILIFAALFRLVMLLAGLPPGGTIEALGDDLTGREVGYDTFLLYDNDIWRYLWDGHVLESGSSPYATTPREYADQIGNGAGAPQAPLESELWWDVLDNISYQSYTTVYPPLAQYLFGGAAWARPGSVFFLKTLLTLADFGTCLVLFAWLRHWGRPPHLLLLYAWNPLAIKEFAGSGHVDALMVLLLTASIYLLFRRREVGAQISLGAAVLAKVGAVVVAPIVLRHTRLRTWWVFPTTLVVLSLPLLDELIYLFRGLGAYSQEWTFNSGPWVALREIFSWMGLESAATWAHLVTKTVILLVIFWATRISSLDENRLIQAVFLILATVVLLNPAVMPWYLLWPLPFAALIGRGSWFVLTGLSLLSYLVYYDPSMQGWWLWIEYGVFALVLAAELRHRSSEA